ncbi:MAG: hypothetical protein KAR05_07880 [Candidatus Omnitrophica bacterium]|nr:hypothetical protein [Candidatus Omnitrophota bacterium]MCK5590353.1 hypothetical protein [Candidatus Paceibacterota bacterium]
MHKSSHFIKYIALWMMLSALPGIIKFIQLQSMDLFLIGEWTYDMFAVFSAIGLLLKKEWARNVSEKVFLLYFFWAIYVVYYLIGGAAFNYSIEWLSGLYHVPALLVKYVLILLIVVYLVWPIIVFFFLAHPRIKEYFRAD